MKTSYKFLLFISIIFISATAFSQNSADVSSKVTEINTFLKEHGINNKYYEQLEVKDGNLIFINIGKKYKLKFPNKRIIPANKINIKKIQAKSKQRKDGTYSATIEFKALTKKGENFYSETLKGYYNNAYVYLKVYDTSETETLKKMLSELVNDLI